MRRIMVLSAAMIGLASIASAQTSDTAPAGAPDAATAPVHHRRAVRRAHPAGAQAGEIRPGHEPGVGESYPASNKASNITAGDSRSTIAPTLPAPAGGANASVRQFLVDAQRALASNQTGRAQEALERAETSMLQRSVPVDQANTPDQAPDVMQVRAAREALAGNNIADAKRAVDAAIQAGH